MFNLQMGLSEKTSEQPVKANKKSRIFVNLCVCVYLNTIFSYRKPLYIYAWYNLLNN